MNSTSISSGPAFAGMYCKPLALTDLSLHFVRGFGAV
jgi:hypothetical protein